MHGIESTGGRGISKKWGGTPERGSSGKWVFAMEAKPTSGTREVASVASSGRLGSCREVSCRWLILVGLGSCREAVANNSLQPTAWRAARQSAGAISRLRAARG